MADKEKNGILSKLHKEFPDIFSEDDTNRLSLIQDEFTSGFKMLKDEGPFVTIFGSARTDEETERYKLGEALGKALAQAGYPVLTGGGPGIMEAVNKGAREGNGKSMGINVTIPSEQIPNRYAIPAISLDHFFVRKVLLLKYSMAYIFMPGGFGTLDELFETITLIQTEKIPKLPVILMDTRYWSGLMQWASEHMLNEGVISVEDLDLFMFADTVKEAVEIVKEFDDSSDEG